MSRERKMTFKPEEWFGLTPEKDTFRRKMMEEARRTARRHLACVSIVVKDKFGSQVMGKFDARYWMWDQEGIEKPPPDYQEIKRRAASRELRAKLKPPAGLFD